MNRFMEIFLKLLKFLLNFGNLKILIIKIAI